MEIHKNSVFLFLIFVLIYAIGSFSRIPFGDCMALVLDTELGIFVKTATPTSHFLYTNAAVLIKNLTALDAILVSRYLVIISGAFVVMMVYRTTHLLTRKNWTAIVTAFVFGFSFTFWRNAEIVEVYTFNLVWVSLFIHFLIKTFTVNENRKCHILLTGLFLSISLWAHIENIFFIPTLMLFLYYFRQYKLSVILCFVLLAVSFSLMIWLNSLQGLPASSIFKSELGTWVEDTFRKDALEYSKDFIKSIAYLIYNFNVFTVLGLFGVLKLFRFNRKLFFTIAVGAVLIYGFSTFYAVTDNYVFFLPFNYLFALGIGFGISHLKVRRTAVWVSAICLLIPLFYAVSWYFVSQSKVAENFNEKKSYKGGLRYYLIPWMNQNVGILEFTVEKRQSPESVSWMIYSAEQYIERLRVKGYTADEIKKL